MSTIPVDLVVEYVGATPLHLAGERVLFSDFAAAYAKDPGWYGNLRDWKIVVDSEGEFSIEVGAILRNGAQIIACKPGTRDYVALVLAGSGPDDYEYITYVVSEKGDAYWGHYFGEDIKAAAGDYVERS